MFHLVPENLRKNTKLPYLVILFLLLAIAASLERQINSTVGEKTIEVGLIEADLKPALYFNLRNIEETLNRYTYVIKYNTTEGETKNETSSINISPGQTFRYSLILENPTTSTMVLSPKIFENEEARAAVETSEVALMSEPDRP